MVRTCFSVLACFALISPALIVSAQAQPVPCRNYPETVGPLLKPRVEALRLLEREAADRLRGLDTRTYLYLAGEAHKLADLMADTKALENEEKSVRQCRNAVPAVRATCRGAALAFAVVVEDEETGTDRKDNRQAYGRAIAACERLIRLAPLNTDWRAGPIN
jgi:hypothetical protein